MLNVKRMLAKLAKTLKYTHGSVLLDSNVVTSGTLSDSIVNYDVIEIFWDITGIRGSSRIHRQYASLATTIFNGSVNEADGYFYGKSMRVQINGTALTIDRKYDINIGIGKNNTVSQRTEFFVSRVVGYK